MSNAVIAFLIALSGGVWLYTKLMRTTGSNTKNSLIASAISGALAFAILFYALSLIN
jgi:hypothetical protein